MPLLELAGIIAGAIAAASRGDSSVAGNGFSQVVRAINQSIGTVANAILELVIEQTLELKDSTDSSTQQILARVSESGFDTQMAVSNSERVLTDLITYGLTRVNDASARRDNEIRGAIGQAGNVINGSINNAVTSILGPISSGNSSILSAIASSDTRVNVGFETVTQLLRRVLDGINQKIENIINNQIIIGGDVFDVILGRIRDVLDIQGNVQLETLRVFDAIINSSIDGGMRNLATVETEQSTQQKRMADSLERLASRPSPFAGEGVTGPAGDYAIGVTIDTIKGWFADEEGDLKEAWDKLMESVAGTNFTGALDDDCLLPLMRRGGSTGFAGWLAVVLTTAMSWGILPFQMATVQANRQLQGFRTCFPDQILSPPQMREMYHILGYSRAELVELFQRQGYSRDDANIIMQTWETVPDITLLMNMYWRKLIGEQELKSELRKHGFRPDMVRSVIDVATYIPPVQDLITMSVRDVFDSATVAQNRQSEDYPREFTDWMARQGVSENWALKYWQAHWRLPSETMGFEMFHRGIIDETRLKSLMKSLDIMPGWRDQLIKLSYNPLTRVDVRRMYSVGVLSEQEVYRAYLDIGYSPDNARRLTDFTVKLTEEEGMLTGDVASDLTKGNILTFYKDHVISREAAMALLLQLDVNAVAAELLLKSADFDIQRKERKQIADIIVTAFQTGRFTFEQALQHAQNSGFNDREREQLTLDLELMQAKEFKLPSRTDLDRMKKKGVIDDAIYIETLVAQGYSTLWAQRYLEAI